MLSVRFTALCALLLLSSEVVSGNLIETAYSRYYNRADIKPLGTLAGKSIHDQGFRTVLPSDPRQPAGQYFIVGFLNSSNPVPERAQVEFYRTDSKDRQTISWSLADRQLKPWLYLGITGDEWPNAEFRPLAWRLTLFDQQGRVLDEWKSFLWEMP